MLGFNVIVSLLLDDEVIAKMDEKGVLPHVFEQSFQVSGFQINLPLCNESCS